MFFIFLMHLVALQFYWYYSLWYFDMIMHFLGGLWVALFFTYVFLRGKEPRPGRSLFLKVLAAMLAIGILWEFYEYYLNIVSATPWDKADTLSDIFFDLFGGLCAIIYLLVPLENQRTGNKE